MIGSGLKKLAAEKGMKVSAGVAYGSLDGYAATMCEGSGWKRIVLTTRFTDAQKQNQLLAQANSRNLQKEFRVQQLQFRPDCIDILFLDNPGTLKKMGEFLNWFMPLLPEHGATGVNICTQCGLEIQSGGVWRLVDGVAYHYHPGCAEKVVRGIRSEEELKKERDDGSLLGGIIGALGGSILGAVVWAIVLAMGYVASLVGVLIGFLAEKGYTLLHGKKSKAKVVILILATIVGVLLGTFGGDAISLARMIGNGELPGFTYGEIPYMLVDMLLYSPEYLRGMMANMGMGFLFAGLGIWGLLRKTSREVSAVKVVDLP